MATTPEGLKFASRGEYGEHEREMPHSKIGIAPPVRTQADSKNDEVSAATATTPTGESLTRQEFKHDADINVLLAKFGVDVLTQQRQPQYGLETDYTLDLQRAYAAVEQARSLVNGVPPELRDKYLTSQQIMAAVESGEYEADLQRVEKDRAEKAIQDKKSQRREELERDREISTDMEAERAAAAARAGITKETPK